MNNLSYSFFGLICSIIGLANSFKQKVDVISIERGSSNNLKEYEELTQKQYLQMQSMPKQKSLIKRCDSTLSDLLNMGSDDEISDSECINLSQDDFDNSDSDYDFLHEIPSRSKLKMKKTKIQQTEEDQEHSDGGQQTNFKKNKTLKRQ